jgi:hypothetical protein
MKSKPKTREQVLRDLRVFRETTKRGEDLHDACARLIWADMLRAKLIEHPEMEDQGMFVFMPKDWERRGYRIVRTSTSPFPVLNCGKKIEPTEVEY